MQHSTDGGVAVDPRYGIPMYEQGNWPHAPVHRMADSGIYIVTGSTYGNELRFVGKESLDRLETDFFRLSRQYEWEPHAWSFFPNHYHVVAASDRSGETLKAMLHQFQVESASWLNERMGTIGKRVWYQFWDTKLTFQRSYLARLKYVHTNPVHHRLVRSAYDYPWCSASWFRDTGRKSFFSTVMNLNIDRVNVRDFEIPS